MVDGSLSKFIKKKIITFGKIKNTRQIAIPEEMPKNKKQLQLDMGIPKIKKCFKCEMIYNNTSLEDIKIHKKYHNPKFSILKCHKIADLLYIVTDRLIIKKLNDFFCVSTDLVYCIGKRYIETVAFVYKNKNGKYEIISEHTFDEFKMSNRVSASAMVLKYLQNLY